MSIIIKIGNDPACGGCCLASTHPLRCGLRRNLLIKVGRQSSLRKLAEGKLEGRSHTGSFYSPPLHFFFFRSCSVSRGSAPSSAPGLELGAGWWLGGGHDLHVLGEDGLERLVPVDHSAKHQRLKETEARGLSLCGGASEGGQEEPEPE